MSMGRLTIPSWESPLTPERDADPRPGGVGVLTDKLTGETQPEPAFVGPFHSMHRAADLI